jgi:hypothetical protein
MHTISVQLVQVVVSAVVALAVVGLTHLFTHRRDLEKDRRQQRVDYLVTAFRALTKGVNHPRLYEVADELSQAIANIQLFGTPEQVRLAQKFAIELGTNKTASMDDLLMQLRDSLRSELGAEPVSGRVLWLHIENIDEQERRP